MPGFWSRIVSDAASADNCKRCLATPTRPLLPYLFLISFRDAASDTRMLSLAFRRYDGRIAAMVLQVANRDQPSELLPLSCSLAKILQLNGGPKVAVRSMLVPNET
jgi:hypothetical protein